MEFPEPVIDIAIEPKTKASQDKMGDALVKLAEEDPTFRVRTDEETGQTIISGMGELHLDIIVDRLLREFNVEANVGAPQVAYKETFTKAVDVDSKYAKQSGGRGQYGHCKVHFTPMEANAEETFKFTSSVVGGAIPKEYIPAVGEGIEEACKTGILGGFPVLAFTLMYTTVLTMRLTPLRWHSTLLVLWHSRKLCTRATQSCLSLS